MMMMKWMNVGIMIRGNVGIMIKGKATILGWEIVVSILGVDRGSQPSYLKRSRCGHGKEGDISLLGREEEGV